VKRQFAEADTLATRMLTDYNPFDYELLLKRARIRQCLMKYEEAVLDANFALKICPTRTEAYYIVSDCLIATQKFFQAVKLLQILAEKEPDSVTLRQQH